MQGLALRPTPDRLRETLFDILAPRIAGTVFVDAYAGSGAVGIEALSRGAVRAVFIENHRGALRTIGENLKALGLEERATAIGAKAVAALARVEADIVFLDPPYDQEGEYDAALRVLSARAAGPLPDGRGSVTVIAQHSVRLMLKEEYGPLRRTRVVKQGDNALSFFEGVRELPDEPQRL